MPNFQGSVNQALGVAGAFAGLAGIPQERREAAKIDKLRESAKSQRDTIVGTLKDMPTDSPEYAAAKETAQYFDEKLGEATRAKFEARPTAKNAQELLNENIKAQKNKSILGQSHERKIEREGAQARLDEEEAAYQDYLDEQGAYFDEDSQYVPNDETRAEQANERAQKQQATRKKRRDFIRDYLSQMQTSMGGKVGDMAPDLQKKIAANYSSKERQRIMNQQDKEKGGKK